MSTKTYHPSLVAIALGSVIVSDFETVTVEREEDKFAFTAGSAGEVTRTKNSNKIGMFTVEIPQTNDANFLLSQLEAVDALFPAIIQDNSGLSIYSIPEASVMKIAYSEFAKTESGTRSWIIKGELVLAVVGGN